MLGGDTSLEADVLKKREKGTAAALVARGWGTVQDVFPAAA